MNAACKISFPPAQRWIECNNAEFIEGESLVEMIHEDLIAKRISIGSCRDIIHYLRYQDAPTSHSLEDMLEVNGQRVGDVEHRV